MKQLSIFRCLLVSALLFNSLFVLSAAQAFGTKWTTQAAYNPVYVQATLTGQLDKESKLANVLLEIKLDDDWKTYWRSPGESGVAPSFKWQQHSKNVTKVNWFWPAPNRYNVLGVETLGYKHQVTLPLSIELLDITQPTLLKGTLTLASCTTICVLNDHDIELYFQPQTLVIDEDIAFAYAKAKSAIPILIDEKEIEGGQHKASITQVNTYWDDEKQQVTIQVDSSLYWQSPDVFIDLPLASEQHVFFSEPNIETDKGRLSATFTVKSWAERLTLHKQKLHITLVDNDILVELISTPRTRALTNEPSNGNIWSMFLIALLGGLILNVMPCVLPVLGMKLTTILSTNTIQRTQIRRQFLASSLGIISTFWLLALFLLGLKLSGEAIGWGIQFQNPYFITLMASVTALFAANMMGLFEIQLPPRMQTWLATTGKQSYFGHYLQGMFATLLATPCSAPFLGTAVAFALGASNLELFAIFSALGLGMALPWLLIVLIPSLALLLPKPGPWMQYLKLFFAGLILATSLWLLSLLTPFIGELNVIVLVVLLLCVILAFIAKKYALKIFLKALTLMLLLSSTAYLSVQYWQTSQADKLVWHPLERNLLEQHVRAGKTVFVDITANWCVTCKANKVAVLLQQPVYSALQAENIILMRGDWTVRADNITQYLQSYSRYGVPFNIVFGPNATQGIELPTLLNADVVLSAIKRARGK